ncbi:hypothetical protein ADS79_31385 [Brevibacillus reuszeri]|uniref:Uncharacterized protein n=1 Tax=Brevibacillus reuszeri TaxID=54915 RepID=A0A0K9YK34_9BACL|nr:hypothetical protein ADS79_31385 [Brevibacillus reuszeri]
MLPWSVFVWPGSCIVYVSLTIYRIFTKQMRGEGSDAISSGCSGGEEKGENALDSWTTCWGGIPAQLHEKRRNRVQSCRFRMYFRGGRLKACFAFFIPLRLCSKDLRFSPFSSRQLLAVLAALIGGRQNKKSSYP